MERIRVRHARNRGAVVPIGTSASRSVGLRYALAPGSTSTPSRMAMIAIATATAGVVAVVAFGAGLQHLVNTPSLYGWTFDALGIDEANADAVRADPDVLATALVRAQLSLQVAGNPVPGYAIRPIEGDVAFPIVRGREPRAPDEVALGADTMHQTGVELGDEVAVAGSDARRTMRVVGQAVFLTDQDAYPLADGALVDFEAAEELGSPDSFQTLGVRFRPGGEDAAKARISKLARTDFAFPSPPAEIEKLQQVRRLPQYLAVFMLLLGVVAVVHAILVSVRRRRRDFGVLRALGFRARDVGWTVTWQAAALAAVGGAIGLPLGVLLGRAVWRAVAHGIGVRAVPSIPVLVLAVVIPAAVLIAVGAALVPALRAARMHPTDLLRSE
jgi:putative ABC transport system permease protein